MSAYTTTRLSYYFDKTRLIDLVFLIVVLGQKKLGWKYFFANKNLGHTFFWSNIFLVPKKLASTFIEALHLNIIAVIWHFFVVNACVSFW